MEVKQAIASRRSIRRFKQTPVPKAVIEEMLEAARLSPTGTNAQPLAFRAILNPSVRAKLFPLTKWAGSIPDGSASPTEATQPMAYVLILIDRTIREKADTDAGAAAMSMILTAQAHGVASCWLGAIDRPAILSLLDINTSRYALHTLLALGYPAQASRAVEMADSVTYYLEDPDSLCVPKRSLADIAVILE